MFNAPALFAEIPEIDITAEGPWSDIEKTTLTVPLVANGSISIDGDVSQEEYGNFPGQLIDPGDNGRIHNFPGDRQWDDAADSSFTFWLAHDETYFYVGVDAKDDVINQDDPNAELWKEDSIESVVDARNDPDDNNNTELAEINELLVHLGWRFRSLWRLAVELYWNDRMNLEHKPQVKKIFEGISQLLPCPGTFNVDRLD